MTAFQPEQPFNSERKLEFKSFLIAFSDGVSRARKIINTLSITSIAALLGLFNSLGPKWNWFPSRMDKARLMYQVAFFDPAEKKC